MSQIGKSSFSAYICDIFTGLHKFPLCIHNTCNINVTHDRTICTFFKFTAQVIRADIKHLCQHFKTDIFLVMAMDITYHFSDPAALSRSLFRPLFPCDQQQKHI